MFSGDLFSAGFTDTSGSSLNSIVFNSLPISGTLRLDGQNISLNDQVSLSDVSTLQYIPNSNFFGIDSVGWFGITSANDTTNSVYTLCEVSSVNDLPEVSDAVYLIEEDQSLSLSETISID